MAKKLSARAAKARLIDSKLAYQGSIFNVYTETAEEPGGHINTRDIIRHNGSVVILAIDESKSKRDPVVIVERQYRMAAQQFLLELPAGRREPNETPLAAAKREMIEETGYRAKKWTKLVRYFASPGFLGEWMEIYLARDLSLGEAQPEADEKIEILHMKLSQLIKMRDAGELHDGKTIIGISILQSRLRAGTL